MKPQQESASLAAAVEIAREVVAGSLTPFSGCDQIAAISRALNDPQELALLSLLAHEQSAHEHIGITRESLEPEITEACRELVQCRS